MIEDSDQELDNEFDHENSDESDDYQKETDHLINEFDDTQGKKFSAEEVGTPLNAKEKRRERNRLLARKSRMKMKTELEGLKSQLAILMKENEALKAEMNRIVTPPVNVVELVKNDIQLPDNISQLIKQLMRKDDKSNITPAKMKRSSFCIANAISVDVPIVYASPGFLKLTGYEMAEILGRNCRFLQGPKTDLREVAKIKEAIVNGTDVTVTLLNYRKDGKTFLNQVQIAHLKDQSGKTFLIVGIQTKLKQSSLQRQYENSATLLGPSSSMSSSASTPTAANANGLKGLYPPPRVLLYPDMKYYQAPYIYPSQSSNASMSSQSNGSVRSGMSGNNYSPQLPVQDFLPRNYLTTPLGISPPSTNSNRYFPYPATSVHGVPTTRNQNFVYNSQAQSMNSPMSSVGQFSSSMAMSSHYPPYRSSSSNNQPYPTVVDSEYDYPPLPPAVFYDFHLPMSQPNLSVAIQAPAVQKPSTNVGDSREQTVNVIDNNNSPYYEGDHRFEN